MMEATPAAPSGKPRNYEPEHDQALRNCLARGLSFSEAAAEMSAKFGRQFTRNALIGRSHRLNIHSRPERLKMGRPRGPQGNPEKVIKLPVKRKGKPYHWRQECAQPSPKIACAHVEPTIWLTFDEMASDRQACKFPYGESDYVYCGHPVFPGFSYCQAHLLLCWQPPRVKQREAAE